MDEKEYLKQISASVRPEKKPKTSFMSSIFFKVGVGGLVIFIMIMILGGIISGGKADLQTRGINLKLHLDNTADVISTYQKSVKSSVLRSSSASLYSVLSNTSRELSDYLTQTYSSYKAGSEKKELKNAAELQKNELDSDLFEAKINGILDRIYAHKMAYEISLFMTEESSIYNSTGSDTLKGILETSYDSLEKLYDAFNEFSETK